MRIIYRLIALFLVLALAGCASEQRKAESPLEYAENAKKAYEEALEDYFDRDWEALVPKMEKIRRNYGHSRYARLAELRIADADYEQDKYAEAIGAYKSFVNDYPNDPEVPYARYKIAKAQFESSSATVLLPPLEERDLSQVRDAYASLRGYLSDFPSSKHVTELSYMLEVVLGLLARHELYVARFYLAEDHFKAAVARVEYALKHFGGSGLEAEALVLLAETYLKMKKPQKARELLETVLTRHSASPFTLPARRLLERIAEPVAVQRIPARSEVRAPRTGDTSVDSSAD
jgi:outer membrane protein assembly factor BamD